MAPQKYWPGLQALQHLVIFGDSYTQTVYPGLDQPEPTYAQPLGVEFPGVTCNEEDTPNWVGYLAKSKAGNPLLVWNYAVGGSTIVDVEQQVKKFVSHLPPRFAIPAGADITQKARAERFRYTLFVIFVGINDCSHKIDPRERVKKMFESSIKALYDTGARNFLFMHVPPRIRPSGVPSPSTSYTMHHWKVKMWNKALGARSAEFEDDHPSTSVIYFSTWNLFTEIYDNPAAHGFAAEDVEQAFGGKMWMDGLHPTSAVHKILADSLHDTLRAYEMD